jgi:hypothetical protein
MEDGGRLCSIGTEFRCVVSHATSRRATTRPPPLSPAPAGPHEAASASPYLQGNTVIMRTTRQLTAAFSASLLLACVVGTASARNLSVSTQNIRATWSSLEFTASELTVRCQVTIEGSFHTRTIAKVEQSLIGAITIARVKQEACTGGTLSAFNGTERYNGTTTPVERPQHWLYGGFLGTLPTIVDLTLADNRYRFGFRDSAGFCTAQLGSETDALKINFGREAGSAITELTEVEGSNRSTVIRRDGGIFCPTSFTTRGTGRLTALGSTTRVSLSLI